MNTNIRDEYREELRQRTRLAVCARFRRGRRRRGCSLPSDALTPAQLRRRNGPVRVFRDGVEVTDDTAPCASSLGAAAECAMICGETGETAQAESSVRRQRREALRRGGWEEADT